MNYIGIDPSITSTGMCIDGNMFSYSYESVAYNKSGLTKWYKLSEHIINFRFHNKVTFNNYIDEQINKLKLYKSIVYKIIEDILDNIKKENTVIYIEGYSYGSSAGNLIDLVTFGTLLRNELLKLNFEIIIISPMTLKLESCKMTYPPIKKIKGKRNPIEILEYRNNEMISGGKFTKKEMYKSIIENGKWNDKWTKHLKNIKKDINNKKIPKPHEDLNDAYLLYKMSLNHLKYY